MGDRKRLELKGVFRFAGSHTCMVTGLVDIIAQSSRSNQPMTAMVHGVLWAEFVE
jgi:fructosamine-3-kinase